MKSRIRRYFRNKRNIHLSRAIEELYKKSGERVKVLDVGGSPFFWETVLSFHLTDVVLLNLEESRDRPAFKDSPLRDLVRFDVGDGRRTPYRDKEFDLVICNSVIEHVGDYSQMELLVRELERVGSHGWVQTPAYGFPIEPHFGLPFVHWLGQPTRARVLKLLAHRKYKGKDVGYMRHAVESVNLLSKKEFLGLFSNPSYRKEEFMFLTKSYIVQF